MGKESYNLREAWEKEMGDRTQPQQHEVNVRTSRGSWLFRRKKNSDTNQSGKKNEVVGIIDLFRFAKPVDLFCMFLATLAAIGHGTAFPLLVLIFGNLTDVFVGQNLDLCQITSEQLTNWSITYCNNRTQLTLTNIFNELENCNLSGTNIASINSNAVIRQQNLYAVGLGIAAIFLAYTQVAFWSISCERQIRRVRIAVFNTLLHKDITYHDTNSAGELINKLTQNVDKIHAGIGDKVGSAEQFISSFVAGIIMGCIRGWKLSLILLSVTPVLFLSGFISTKLTAAVTSEEFKSYGKAGAIAEQVFTSIRTVVAYNGAEYEQSRFNQQLTYARKKGIQKGAGNGILMGVFWFVVYGMYALGFWYGAKLVSDEGYTIGEVLLVFYVIITGVSALGQAAPHIQAFAEARGAAYKVWEVLDSAQTKSPSLPTPIKNVNLEGLVQFRNVKFAYPKRTEVEVLKGVTFDVKRGETVALVGSSGCGKSTCLQLLQQFYDALSGTILVDGRNIKEYDLTWFRQQIGVVGQEPVLFATTIRENIQCGLTNVSIEKIQEAALKANAHHFIMKLPDKYDTVVGERGAQLSGGQRQRIALARALVRNAAILLLDEATSALDLAGERIVQEALERAAEGRTTIVVAHRLSTIKNANRIIVLNSGRIVEEGDHKTLMEHRGQYYRLVEAQLTVERPENDSNPISNEDDHANVKKDTQLAITESRRRSSHNDLLKPEENHLGVKQPKRGSLFWELMKINKPEWVYVALGCCACLCNGGIQPAFGVVLAKVVVAFEECDLEVRNRSILLYVGIFVIFGVVSLFTMFFQYFLFAVSGESLTQRVRSKAFNCMLRQEIAWYDSPSNNVGALCARLSSEASAVQGASGARIAILLQNFANLGAGIVVSLVFDWALALMSLAFVPFMIAAGFLQTYLLTGFATKDKKSKEGANKTAAEALQNIRAVLQLAAEREFGEKFARLLQKPFQSSMKRAHVFGFFFGFTNSVIYFAQAALVALGAHLIRQKQSTFEDLLIVYSCILFGALAVGQTVSLAPDYGKAVAAAENMFQLFDRRPEIDNISSEGQQLPNIRGQIEFRGVNFSYPTRAEIVVLRNFKLKIDPGYQVAFVGTSGCGKSTTAQLLLRFYDGTGGSVHIDSHDIRGLDLQWYRSQVGIVNQEPVLFDGTIAENIAYGDLSRKVPIEEIIEAAKKANVHQFIENLPKGYNTDVGAYGAQLSGGQKQRIAIARVLIRNPRVLILDEATSALDVESEKAVQDALDVAKKDRTSITIAHRLTTIKNADLICVLHEGEVIESGTHEELLNKQGAYYNLVNSQSK